MGCGAFVALAMLLAGPAAAEEPDAASSDGLTQLTMPKERALVLALLQVNLSTDAAAEPVSLAPDGWYGVTDELTLGLTTSSYAGTGFLGGVGNGLCFTGDDNGCDGVVGNLGLQARYHVLRHGDVLVAADGGVFAQDFDPFAVSLKLGAIGQWSSGKLSVVFNPSLFIGLTERDIGNEEILYLPVSAMYDVTDELNLGLQTGAVLPFADVGNLWQLPVTFGGQYLVHPKVFVLASFSLLAVAGGDLLETGADARSINVGAGFVL